jgi:hypothetical protein
VVTQREAQRDSRSTPGRTAPEPPAAGARSRRPLPRPIDGLFDLDVTVAPDGGLATPDRPDRSLTGADLAELVRRGGGAGRDVRLLVAAGDHNRPTIEAMAHDLGRDVLVAPSGSTLRPVAPGGDGADLVPVDVITGYPLDWIAVAPAAPRDTPQCWFDLVGGIVLTRTGTVIMPLPGGGLSFATRDDFVLRRTAAAALRPGHPGLVTVAIGNRSGEFVLGDYSGQSILCDGQALAAALAALPLYGCDLRMWLAWPEPPDDRVRLRHNLAELAAVTGATVWAPAEGGRADLLDGCRDLSAVGPDDRVTRWDAHGEPGQRLFRSDVDGRLVPAGGVAASRYPGVPLVSVLPAREREMRTWYERLRPDQRVLRADLAVLADGRVALRYRDDSLLAAGAGQLRQLLTEVGWSGGDLALLASVPEERTLGARRHLENLAADLGCAITVGERPELRFGTPAGPPAPSPALTPQAPAPSPALTAQAPSPEPPPALSPEPKLPAAEPAPAATPAPSTPAPVSTPPPSPSLSTPTPAAMPAPSAPSVGALPRRRPDPPRPVAPADPAGDPYPQVEEPAIASRFIDGPRLGPAARTAPPHGVAWLPAQPQVNQEEVDLFVACPGDPGQVVADGIASPYLLLLGHLDRDRLAARTGVEHLVQVTVAPGGAVDVSATEVVPPQALRAALADRDVYLLPAGWLDRARLVAAFRVAPGGWARPQLRFGGEPALLRCADASHGVPGLPVEVERWPRGRLRTTVTGYVLVGPGEVAGLGDGRRLYQRRPETVDGGWLLEVRVGRGRAIDVAATAERLAGLSSVRTRLPQIVTAGVEYLIPVASYPTVVIEHEYRGVGRAWQRVSSPGPRRLDTWVPATD